MDVATLANKPFQTGRVEDEAAVEIPHFTFVQVLTQVGGKQMG